MALAEEHLAAGDLAGARAALTDRVRAAPQDHDAQLFLFQVMALQGDWEKAAARLRVLVALDPDAQAMGVVYDHALAAERMRAEVFAGRAAPHMLSSPSPWTAAFAAGALRAAAGFEDGVALRDGAADQALGIPGRWNDQDIDWLIDTDQRFGPCLEAIVAGRWGLLPFEAIAEIRSEGPRNLRDLIWLPAQIRLRSGESAHALLPVRYPGTEHQPDDGLRLARQTVWTSGPQGVTALGQHVYTVREDLDLELLSLRSLVLAT